jgi:hypothetical protein
MPWRSTPNPPSFPRRTVQSHRLTNQMQLARSHPHYLQLKDFHHLDMDEDRVDLLILLIIDRANELVLACEEACHS